MIRVLIAGEGSNELGPLPRTRFEEAGAGGGSGVIEAMMAEVRSSGWTIRAAIVWKDVTKLTVNTPGDGDARTVAVLALRARELGCNALVFLRDRDGDSSRERAIRDAIVEASRGPRHLHIAGGVPIEKLECWLLALKGEKNAHADPDPEKSLDERHGVPPKRGTAMVQLVRSSGLLAVPPDATSLWRWFRLVARALSVKIPKTWH